MASENLNNYLSNRMDELTRNLPYFCGLTSNIIDYMKISELLKASGHDTANLDTTIAETLIAIEKLKKVNSEAVLKFKNEGIHITTDKKSVFEDESESLI